MKFASPYLLNLLWGLLPVAAILVYGMLRRKKILAGFAHAGMLSSIIPGFDPRRRQVKAVLILLAAAFAIVALAGPRMGFHWEKVKQKGVDIMIALDCSRSMLAQDIKPSRLERAKREIIDLLRMMRSDRAGLVAFSGNAILQCPLTLDHDAFNIFLKVLEPGFLPTGGTNLDAAIQTCYSGFEKETDTEKAIILITDGESTSGDVEKTVREMAKENIKIFCIGVGNMSGAPIPDESGGFKKDASGNIVLAKVDESGLEKIADMTGGAYVRSVAGDMDLDVIYMDRIHNTMERKTLVSGKKKVWENRYQWFLFPAMILLLIEFFIRAVRPRSTGLFLFFAVFCLLAHPQPGEARSVSKSVKDGIKAYQENQYEKAEKHFIDAQLEDPDDDRLYYNIGTTAYQTKDYEQAKKNFGRAAKSKDPALRHKAEYNLANTAYQLGDLDGSISGYEKLLKEFPDDVQAKENLEFVKQKKQEQQQSKSDQGKDPNKNQDNNQDKKNQNKDNKGKNKEQQKKDGQKSNQDKEKDSSRNNKNNNKDKKDSQQQGDQQEQKDQQAGKNKTGQDGNPPPPREDKSSSPNKDQGKGQDKGRKTKPSQDQDPGMARSDQGGKPGQNMEKMLNRLEDKPGQAMIPMGQGQDNGKDW